MPTSRVDLLRAACCLAGLDREICDQERPLLEALAFDAGVGAASLQAMINRAREDQDFYQEQYLAAREDPEPAVGKMLAVAAADGEITLEQRVILQHFAQKLGMEDRRFAELIEKAERVAQKKAKKQADAS
ncbi:MAG: hypothetical protein WD009_04650 [Phycisphaeraceae bacterium]